MKSIDQRHRRFKGGKNRVRTTPSALASAHPGGEPRRRGPCPACLAASRPPPAPARRRRTPTARTLTDGVCSPGGTSAVGKNSRRPRQDIVQPPERTADRGRSNSRARPNSRTGSWVTDASGQNALDGESQTLINPRSWKVVPAPAETPASSPAFQSSEHRRARAARSAPTVWSLREPPSSRRRCSSAPAARALPHRTAASASAPPAASPACNPPASRSGCSRRSADSDP